MTSAIVMIGLQKKIALLHAHNREVWKTTLATNGQWQAEGRNRYDGRTHAPASALAHMHDVMNAATTACIPTPYSVEVRDAEKRLLPLARDLGIAVVVNRSFEGGGLFGRVLSKELPAVAREFGCRSWAQAFLKFILSRPEVTVVIPATS